MSIKASKISKKRGLNLKKLLEYKTLIAKALSDKAFDTDMYNLKAGELSLKGQNTQLLSLMSGSLIEISTSNKYLAKLKEAELKLKHHEIMMNSANKIMQSKIEMMKYNHQVKKDKADIISNLAKDESSDCDTMVALLKLYSGTFTKDDKCLKFFKGKTVEELNSLYVIKVGDETLGTPSALMEVVNGLNMYNK